jgi:hypothetical protein
MTKALKKLATAQLRPLANKNDTLNGAIELDEGDDDKSLSVKIRWNQQIKRITAKLVCILNHFNEQLFFNQEQVFYFNKVMYLNLAKCYTKKNKY